MSLPLAALGCADDADDECANTTSAAIRVCASGATVRGVDVSYYQGTIDWAAAKKSGQVFAFVRVSDGVTHPDSQFVANWQGTKAAGVVRGVYQFFRPAQDPDAQADLLVSKLAAAGPIGPGDLPAVLDVESADGQASSVVVANAKRWLARVEQRTGRRPLVYTAAFMSSVLGSGLSAWPLWVANYGVSCPTMPDGWQAWVLWQSSSTGKVTGINGDVDLDEFNGTLADLLAFATPRTDAGSAAATDAGLVLAPPPRGSEALAETLAGEGSVMGSGAQPTVDPTRATQPSVPRCRR